MMPRTCVVPAGEFDMGESEADKFANDTERPRHRVTISRPFRLGVFPVTVAEYRRFTSHPTEENTDLPVVSITWTEARSYCDWLSGQTREAWRLPSEAEWEYACRAGTHTPFFHGLEIDIDTANFLYDEHGTRIGKGSRTPAGTYAPNAFGLEAMHGNVCEWCADTWHPTYHGAPDDGSAWIDSGPRVIRGGAWDYLPRLLRSSWRDALPATSRRDNLGFRIAADLP